MTSDLSLQVWQLSADRKYLRAFGRPDDPYGSVPVSRGQLSGLRGTSTAPRAVHHGQISSLWGESTFTQPVGTLMDRPTGTGYYAIEDIGVGMDLQKGLDRLRSGGFAPNPATGQPCLTLPEGDFVAAQFRNPSASPVFTFLSEQVGLVGSGKGTRIMTEPNSMTQAERDRIPPEFQPNGTRTAVTKLNPFFTLCLNKVKEAGQFYVQATPQLSGRDGYGGLRCQYSRDGLVLEDVWARGYPGYLNSPPGETYNIAMDTCYNTTVRRAHADGRDPVTEVRRSAIGFGITNCNNWVGYDCTAENMGYSHGFVWWQCNGVTTYDAVATRNGSTANGASQQGQAGWGLNHEQTNNSKHYRPRLGWNTGGDVRYYSNLGGSANPTTTGPHLIDSVVILDGSDFNVLLEKYQSWSGANSPTQPGITLTNCPTPKWSNNQNVP